MGSYCRHGSFDHRIWQRFRKCFAWRNLKFSEKGKSYLMKKVRRIVQTGSFALLTRKMLSSRLLGLFSSSVRQKKKRKRVLFADKSRKFMLGNRMCKAIFLFCFLFVSHVVCRSVVLAGLHMLDGLERVRGRHLLRRVRDELIKFRTAFPHVPIHFEVIMVWLVLPD